MLSALSSRLLREPSFRFLLLFCVLGACRSSIPFAFGQAQVVTEHNDVFRTGANPNETVLTTANVNFNSFGKLFTQSVDGYIVGQPLYLPGLTFPDGSTHNVVYVATQHDSVFAFDADTAGLPPLWTTSFINPALGITSVPIIDFGCAGTGFVEIGIVSTPVIDPAQGTIFVLAKTLENGSYVFRLHALSVTTGADLATPAVINASVPTNTGTLQFNPAIQMQRPALLLENGTIYIGFGSNGCDTFTYHGWLLAYDETSLQQVGAFATTPNGKQGAIWQAGGGPAADVDGSIFVAIGNGTFDAASGGSDYGDSVLHLNPASSGFGVLDYFTPYNQQTLNSGDFDLGSGGVILLPDQDTPHTHEIMGGGKQGTVYLMDRTNLGGFNSQDDSQIVQSLIGAASGELVSVPAYWNGNVYITGQTDHIKAFSLANDLLSLTPTSQSAITAPIPGSVSISANGSTNGILWDLPQSSSAVLYAFDATNLNTVLYNSTQASGLRDKVGNTAKFVPPTIANGKVYVAGTSALSVFGLLPLISQVSGNNQSVFVGTTLPVPLEVQTVDAYQGNPLVNVAVTCKDGGAGGIFSATMPMMTNSLGQAVTNYTLPKIAKTVTITCTATGFVKSTFTEVGIAGPVSRAVLISGNNQSALVSTQLAAPLVMKVYDPFNYGIPGITVTFSDGGAGGSFSPASVITGSTGSASTLYTVPSTAGKYTITATTAGLSPLKFTETASIPNFTLTASPSTLTVTQGNTGTSTITVNPTFGFSGSVNLTASGLPSGVSASFNPDPATGSSTVTFTASSTASTGTWTVTVTGTSGSLTQKTKITLTVTTP